MATLVKLDMRADIALRGCPFCGETETQVWLNEAGMFYVKCPECGASSENCATLREATELWNRRV